MKKIILLISLGVFVLASCTTHVEDNTQAETITPDIHTITKCNSQGQAGEGEKFQTQYCDSKRIAELIDITSLSNGVGENTGIYFINIPVFSSEKNTQMIREAMVGEIENFLSDTSLLGSEKIKKELHGDFKIYTSQEATSVVFELYKYLGGANGESYVRTFAFDEKGGALKLGDIVPSRDSFRVLLEETLRDDSRVFSEIDISGVVDDFMKNPHFFLNQDSLIVVFQQYEVAAGSEGNIYIDFLMSDIDGLQTENSDSGDAQETFETPNNSQQKDTHIAEKTPAEKIQKQETQLFEAGKKEEGYRNTSSKKIALTFDDGPSKLQTPRLLKILETYNVPATFYVLGKNVSYFPEIVKQISQQGHEIGNHSWSHAQLTRLGRDAIISEMKQTDELIQEITGVFPATYRPPYGAINQTVSDIFSRPAIMWTVDTLDWKNRNVAQNIQAAVTPTKDGNIILFHDIHAESVDSIGEVIRQLRDKGFTFVTVSELLEYGGTSLDVIKTCYSAYNCK